MDNKDHRKTLHNKEWGIWRYDADLDHLVCTTDKITPYYLHEIDNTDCALHWLADMSTKRSYNKAQDMQDLAQALSEIIQCPGLANAYDTRHHTLRKSKYKVIRDSGPACDNCADRFKCFTDS